MPAAFLELKVLTETASSAAFAQDVPGRLVTVQVPQGMKAGDQFEFTEPLTGLSVRALVPPDAGSHVQVMMPATGDSVCTHACVSKPVCMFTWTKP